MGGGFERTDIEQFLLGAGVMVLKELVFNSFHIGLVVALKELICNSFHCGLV